MKYLKKFNEVQNEIELTKILDYQEDIEDALLYASDIFTMRSNIIKGLDRYRTKILDRGSGHKGPKYDSISIWKNALHYNFRVSLDESDDDMYRLCNELERSSKLLNHINCDYGFEVMFYSDNAIHWDSNQNWEEFIRGSSVIKKFCEDEYDLEEYNSGEGYLIKDIKILMKKIKIFNEKFAIEDQKFSYNNIDINLYIW